MPQDTIGQLLMIDLGAAYKDVFVYLNSCNCTF